MRVGKNSGGVVTKYIYDGDKLVTQISPTCRLDFFYDEEGKIFALAKDFNTKYYYVSDSLNNILGLIDSNGSLVVEYDYTAYGVCFLDDSSGTGIGSLNPIRWKGYYYDTESGMYYCQTRYYVPDWCRWLNADSAKNLNYDDMSVVNLFAYCRNNPLIFVDPNGCFPVLAVMSILGVVGFSLSVAGIIAGNYLLTAIGLSMVAIPALISGGLAIAAGLGGAMLTGIVGGITFVAGIGAGLFASAEYQQQFCGENWIKSTSGMDDVLYNTLLLLSATIATLGTVASSIGYSFEIKSISQVGKFGEYNGFRFVNSSGKTRVLSFHTHGHKIAHGIRSIGEWHWQLQKWNPLTLTTSGTIARWIWWSLSRF